VNLMTCYPRATCHIAGWMNSIRHIENRSSPYFIFFVFYADRWTLGNGELKAETKYGKQKWRCPPVGIGSCRIVTIRFLNRWQKRNLNHALVSFIIGLYIGPIRVYAYFSRPAWIRICARSPIVFYKCTCGTIVVSLGLVWRRPM